MTPTQKFSTQASQMNNPSLQIFFQLLKRSLLILKRDYWSKLFDTAFLFFTNVIVFSYFMGAQGLSEEYGPFLMVGAIASFGLFDVVAKVSELIGDIEGEKTISHLITLPLSSRTLFCFIAIFWAINAAVISFPLFFLGKILLFTRFNLSDISFIRLIPIFLTANLFYGFFALWLSAIVRGMGDLTSIFMRYINPIFMFGGYFYSWKNAFQLDHLIGYVSLLNPMVYIMEGMRSSVLGPSAYLPYWTTLIVLWGFIYLLGWHATKRLKIRIDCI